MVTAATVAAAVLVVAAPGRIAHPWRFAGVTAAVAVFETAPILALRGRVLHSYTVTEAALIPGFVLLSPGEVVWAVALGSLVDVRGRCWHKAVYNVSAVVIAAAAATLAVGEQVDRNLGGPTVARLVGGAAAFAVVSLILAEVALVVGQGRHLEMRESLGRGAISTAVGSALGLVAAAVSDSAAALPALAGLATVLVLGARAAARDHLERDRTACLVEAAARLAPLTGRDEVRSVLVEVASRIAGAPVHLAAAPPDGGDAVAVDLPEVFAPDRVLVAPPSAQRFPGDRSPLAGLRTLVALGAGALESVVCCGPGWPSRR